MQTDSATWAVEHSAALVGLPAAAAEHEVVSAGFRPRIAAPGVMMTLDFRPERVSLITDAAGIVTRVQAG